MLSGLPDILLGTVHPELALPADLSLHKWPEELAQALVTLIMQLDLGAALMWL